MFLKWLQSRTSENVSANSWLLLSAVISAVIFAFAHGTPASAQESGRASTRFSGLVISSIDLVGLKRIEADAVRAKLTSKAGTVLNREVLAQDVKSIFGMGFFEDIQVEAQSDSDKVKLRIVLKERPAIGKIEFEGNENQTTDELSGVIKVKEWSILDEQLLKDDVQLLLKHYETKGFYMAKVDFVVTPVKDGEVKVTYKVKDYDKIQIKKIAFLGNKAFSDEKLKGVLAETKEGGMLSFFTSSGNFKESAFKNDLQRLTLFYLDNGYVKYKNEAPIVTVSEDKRFMFITIKVDEGIQYKVRKIDFSGDLLFSREELSDAVQMKSDETFSLTKRNNDIQTLTEKYQDLGYAFANVIPKMDVKDDEKVVDLDYSFEKGNLAYFGEISIVGNAKTYDKVIRRELKIKEGELYHGTRFRKSRENVERLGFFAPGEVLFNTSTPKGRNDLVNIEIQVKERPTGQVNLSAGYGTVNGLFFQTSLSDPNLFGRGQSFSVAATATTDRRNKSLNIGFTDPYAFDTRWSLGGDLFYTTFFFPGRYITRRVGANGRVGYPLSEYVYGFLTYKLERLNILQLDITEPNEQDLKEIAQDTGTLSSLTWSVVRDKRNNRFETSDGSYQSVALETAGVGGEKTFIKGTLNNRFYRPLFAGLVLRTNLEYGQAQGYGFRGVPPSERFYLGGPNSLRGFDFYSVGPFRTRSTSQGTSRIPVGGRYQTMGQIEIEAPLVKEAGLKFVTFYDVGNVFSTSEELRSFQQRQNFGLGFRWFSPLGPLRFEWGFPLSRRPGESGSVFQFFIGPPF